MDGWVLFGLGGTLDLHQEHTSLTLTPTWCTFSLFYPLMSSDMCVFGGGGWGIKYWLMHGWMDDDEYFLNLVVPGTCIKNTLIPRPHPNLMHLFIVLTYLWLIIHTFGYLLMFGGGWDGGIKYWLMDGWWVLFGLGQYQEHTPLALTPTWCIIITLLFTCLTLTFHIISDLIVVVVCVWGWWMRK
jgi:hypothetical protein